MQTTTPSQVTHCPTAEPTNSRAGTSTAHSAEPAALRTPDRAGRELPVPLPPSASTAVPDALMSPELLSLARSCASATIYNVHFEGVGTGRLEDDPATVKEQFVANLKDGTA
ncbi:hypothetical protein GCM10010256_39010 [Streptomyces coeruleorubidus]|nr:hypothetical protein GCM10010256_39010 [Streptomyces coeruleorubidus]